MKTKHLFVATALVASFASCTNDDIVEMQQGVANANRPTVDNVQLNFAGEGVDSRLTFGSKGYAWEATDVIGALLMDQPNDLTSKDWATKYKLSNWVNTSYPFSYDASAKVWSNDAKMLEGNYFFAFPFESYDGGREVIHSLTEQTQVGVASKAVAESYAKNQFFVGYSQIFGGTEAEDALENVEMTSILGGLQFRIINNGSKTYHINKIVVKGAEVASELQLKPIGETSGENHEADDFNYAHYVGDKKSSIYDDAVVEDKDFERAALLRALVYGEGNGKAQLNITGTKAERAIAKGATGYAVVMVNPIEEVSELALDIYTDEGVIANISLTSPVVDKTSSAYEGYLVDKEVEEIAHDVANTIIVKFTDDAVGSIQTAEIYSEKDLLQLIEWNANSDIKVNPIAQLKKDVEFTKEMFDLLKSNKKVTLTIKNYEPETVARTAKAEVYELTLAEDLPADVLEYEGLDIEDDVELVVAGTIELTDAETLKEYNKMTIAEGAVLNVDNAEPVLPLAIINEGTINFGKETIATVELTNEETGIINIVKGADVKGSEKTKFVNYGTVNNNGYVEHITNETDAVIVLGENATLKDLDNKAKATVNTANGTLVTGTNSGLINWVTGAVVEAAGGMIAAEAPASVAKDAYKDTNINTLTLKENTVTTFASAETGGIVNVIAAKGAVLKVADGVALSLTELIVEENMSIITGKKANDVESSLTVGTVTIDEEVELTNSGKLIVSTEWTNDGIVYNNGSAKLPDGYTAENWGVFKYALPNADEDTSAATTKAAALKDALAELIDEYGVETVTLEWFNRSVKNVGEGNTDYPKSAIYNKNYGSTDAVKTEYDAAILAIKTGNTATLKTALMAEDVKLAVSELNPTVANTSGIEFLYKKYDVEGTENDKTAKTVAYDVFRTNVVSAASGTSWNEVKNSVKMAAEKLSDADVDDILAAKAPNAFIWDGCNLQKAIAVWKSYDGIALSGNAAHDYEAAFRDSNGANVVTRFVEWAKAGLKDETIAGKLGTASVDINTLPTFSKYTVDQFKACNN